MAKATKNPNMQRAAHLPWDKEGALPIPAGAPKARRAGAASRGGAAEAHPPSKPRRPAREEYPGPQTSSTGEHIEPGNVRPFRRRGE